MDKKKLVKVLPPEDAQGFEDFIEGQPNDVNFFSKNVTKKEYSFEHFTFLTNDSERLLRLKNLLNEKVPFISKFEQGGKLIADQNEEIIFMREKIFDLSDLDQSPFKKSLSEIFNSFFKTTKS